MFATATVMNEVYNL